MDRMEQALELGSMLIRMKSVEGAIKVANAKRLFALSEKLGRTLQYRMDEEALQQEAVAGYMPLSASYHENSQQPSAPAQYADPFQERAPAAAGDEPLVGPKATSGLRALKEKLASKENAGGKRKAADGEGRVPGNNPFAKKAAKAVSLLFISTSSLARSASPATLSAFSTISARSLSTSRKGCGSLST
mmetsp:Transcript_29557/g.94817  ORF Transcript_29557/g.94817 Transcript_29557/m.94817 type:complete len:189 (-) Transcript_29557:3122-3688(-)